MGDAKQSALQAGYLTPMKGKLKIAVCIATSGRPSILSHTIGVLLTQSRAADALIVCPAKDTDIEPAASWRSTSDVSIVHSEVGATKQRNALIEAAWHADVIVFFDDDFFPENTYLEEIEKLFCRETEVTMATGTVIADGILGPGLSPEEARRRLSETASKPAERLDDVHNAYGCNMAVRMAAVRALDLRFDERLPLYSWLEDVDFSRRLAPAGRIVRSSLLRGVHLGNKSGRSKGVRLGYSQIANPLYMVRKGTLSRGRAYRQIGRNVLSNSVRTLRPEPWVDRKGRLIGNLRGALDALRGRIDPEHILKL